ncbi:cyclic nucleotide-binding domain-containing protein [uncultured Ilyobacter sp.]|uniref:Crp/Fnr family transcriptional regulator n=1 Tax=uncultured Ilyobacter sp. TaxID=544433 RepID=UPI0029C91062|nr:cyclic nucleotide-binding domain-containing protein [uncultured Ilyobacter sp.]
MNEDKKLEILQMIDKISIFGGLSNEQAEKILDQSNYLVVSSNENVMLQGMSPKSIYVIIKGKVEVYEESNNKIYPMMYMGVGECFGEVEILGIFPNMASVKTVEETEFIEIPKNQLHKFCHKDMRIFNILILNMAREACRRLAKSDRALMEYMGK